MSLDKSEMYMMKYLEYDLICVLIPNLKFRFRLDKRMMKYLMYRGGSLRKHFWHLAS